MSRKVTPDSPEREPRDAAGGVTLLLPGMTLESDIFPPIAGPVVSVSFNDLVLSPDGWTPELGARGVDVYVDLLTERLARAAAWSARRRVVVAHSFGGMVALRWLTAAHRERPAGITKLVLIGTTAGPLFERVRLRLIGVGNWEFRVPLAPLIPIWNHPRVTRTVKRLVSGGLKRRPVDFRALGRPSDFKLDVAGWRNTDWRAMRSFRLAMRGFDVRADLARLEIPTVVLHGTRDSLFPVSVAQELASLLPNAELRLVEGAGHALPLTHGEAVQEAIGR